MPRKRFSPFRGDRSLWIIIAVLCIISLLVVYSSTASMAYRNVAGDTSYYLLRQARFILFGFILIFIIHWVDIRHYLRFSKFFFNLSIILMILAYLIGISINDAARWIRIPIIGITFQPADAIKITLSMVLAIQLGTRQGIINRIPILPALSRRGWRLFPQKNFDILHRTTKPILLPIFLACAVIMPSNLSTAMIIFATSMIVLLVGRVKVSQLWKLMWISGLALMIIISGMKIMGIGRAETWLNRIENYAAPLLGVAIEKDEAVDFQELQAKIAISSGGITGKGPGNSTQRSQLPHPYSDFAYAFIIEEYGIIGAMLIPMLYLWIFYRARVIINKTKRPVSALLVLGLSLTITLSAFIHIFVSTGIVPVTGQALPLISLGGSSVLFTSIAFGIMLSVSRESNEEEAAERAAIKAAIAMQNRLQNPPPKLPQNTPQSVNMALPKISDANSEFEVVEHNTPNNSDNNEKIIVNLDDDE